MTTPPSANGTEPADEHTSQDDTLMARLDRLEADNE